jgi:hypothetical protein
MRSETEYCDNCGAVYWSGTSHTCPARAPLSFRPHNTEGGTRGSNTGPAGDRTLHLRSQS